MDEIDSSVNSATVIGSGNMGSSIAEVMAFNGYEVTLIDLDEKLLERGKKNIERVLQSNFKFAEGRAEKEIYKIESMGINLTEDQKTTIRKKFPKGDPDSQARDIMKKVHATTDYSEAADSEFVFEAVFEKMEVKRDLFRKLSGILPEKTIVASNTSSLSITEIAGSYSRPENTVIAHFFNPPYTLPLVEIVPGLRTSDSTVDRVISFISGLRNHRTSMAPIRVRESPGFVVNRILVPMINEAIALYGEGIASKEDIDRAMKLGAGMPMGPLELADMVGLDILLDVAEVFVKDFGDQKYRAPYNLKRMVAAGDNGRKSGKGFYDYR